MITEATPPSAPEPAAPPPAGPIPQRVVEVSFSADRNQLYIGWNAIANLADLAGKVSVSTRVESEKGFDRNKLHNGVIEPLGTTRVFGKISRLVRSTLLKPSESVLERTPIRLLRRMFH